MGLVILESSDLSSNLSAEATLSEPPLAPQSTQEDSTPHFCSYTVPLGAPPGA
jgi:hypothetical protein